MDTCMACKTPVEMGHTLCDRCYEAAFPVHCDCTRTQWLDAYPDVEDRCPQCGRSRFNAVIHAALAARKAAR